MFPEHSVFQLISRRMFKLISFRAFSTASKRVDVKLSKADVIKRLNYENKALFGAVVKPKKKKSTPSKATAQEPKNETEFSSEMFWLSKNVSQLQGQKASDVVATVESIVPYCGLPTPFSPNELNAITKFPIVPTQKGIIEKGWSMHEKKESNEYKSPSVNRVLSATMPEASRQALLRWKMGKIAELGEEGFQKLQKDIFERGSHLHSTLETWLSGNDPSDEMIGKSGTLWKSIYGALSEVERPAKIVERKLYHPYLHYNGVVDCITAIRGQPHIIEWKTSDNLKATVAATYDAPIQLCAYLGALQASNEWSEGKLQNGAIFVAYTDGKPAHLHLLSASDMRRYWHLWLQRLQEYWIRYRDGTLPESI